MCTCVCVPVTCAQLTVHVCPHRASVCLLASSWCRHPASLCPGVDVGVVCVDMREHWQACGGPSDLVFCVGSLAVLKRSPRATGGEGQQGPSGSQSQGCRVSWVDGSPRASSLGCPRVDTRMVVPGVHLLFPAGQERMRPPGPLGRHLATIPLKPCHKFPVWEGWGSGGIQRQRQSREKGQRWGTVRH